MIPETNKPSRDVLKSIVDAAHCAPSAENLQPWRFVIGSDCITVLLDEKRQLASDVNHMLGLMSVGACIENAIVAASGRGWRTLVATAESSPPGGASDDAWPVAKLTFSRADEFDSLSDFIRSRSTVRRMISGRAVPDSTLHKLSQSCDRDSDVRVHWVGNRQLEEFACLIGIGNRIRFEHRPFHEELYQSFRFSRAEVQSTRDGLDVVTLQLPAGVTQVLRALRTWPSTRFANVLGFSRAIARQAAQEVVQSGAVGFVTIPNSVAKHFVSGGRALERLWLTATSLELGFHPMAGLAVFIAHSRAGGAQLLPKHRHLASQLVERFSQLYPELSERTMPIAFRIGYASNCTRSLRRTLTDVIRYE